VRDLFEILDATVGSVEGVEGAPVSYNVVGNLHNTSKYVWMHGGRVAVPVVGVLQ
jgi:hypothetical protein